MTPRLEKRLSEQRTTRRNQFLLILICLLLFISVAGGTYYWATGNKFETTRRTDASVTTETPKKVNILVLGVDERSDDVGRSDTIFVVTVDASTKDVSLLSIPRDTRVRIPGYGWDKINHAYALGGHKLSQRAVEDLLAIPIDYYAIINFAGFHKIVDAVGGVSINVEKRMYYEDPYDNLLIDFKPGLQKMDGKTAIKYVRYRDEDGDIGRIERQQKFIKTMFQELASPFILPRIPGIIREVDSALHTDMSTAEMLSIAKLLNDAAKSGLKAETVPGDPAYIANISYWLPDIVELRKYVALSQGLPADNKFVLAAKSTAAQYERSIPKEMEIIDVPKKPTVSTEDKKDDRDGDKKDGKKTGVADPKASDKSKTTVKSKTVDKQKAIDKPKAVERDKKIDKPKAPQTKTPAVTGKLRFEVINASGVPEAGEKMAALLRGQGYDVIRVAGMSSANRNTVVVANSSEAGGKLTGLPFRYVLQVNQDDSRAGTVQVIVGKDYVN